MKVNEYFGGSVKSISFENDEGKATAGVMAAGEYEFGTSEVERINVVSGELQIKLPGDEEYKSYAAGTEFHVAAGVKFGVRVFQATAYVCFYG